MTDMTLCEVCIMNNDSIMACCTNGGGTPTRFSDSPCRSTLCGGNDGTWQTGAGIPPTSHTDSLRTGEFHPSTRPFGRGSS